MVFDVAAVGLDNSNLAVKVLGSLQAIVSSLCRVTEFVPATAVKAPSLEPLTS